MLRAVDTKILFKFKTMVVIFKYLYKDIISVCLFERPIINHEPLDRFASNFD